MADLKQLSQMHMDIALQLSPRLGEPGVSTEMVATYLATPGQLVKARKDPAVMETLTEQAAELLAENSAELLSDFFGQFKRWNKRSLASLELPTPQKMAAAVMGTDEAIPASSSSS